MLSTERLWLKCVRVCPCVCMSVYICVRVCICVRKTETKKKRPIELYALYREAVVEVCTCLPMCVYECVYMCACVCVCVSYVMARGSVCLFAIGDVLTKGRNILLRLCSSVVMQSPRQTCLCVCVCFFVCALWFVVCCVV